jgi:predicted ester cyclase
VIIFHDAAAGPGLISVAMTRAIALFSIVLAACSGDDAPEPDAGVDVVAANKDLLRRYHEDVWDQGHLDHAGMYIGAGFVTHAVVTTLPPGQVAGPDFLAQFRIGFPDMRSHADAILGDGDLVVVQWTITGTHTGTFLGVAPTNKPITVSGMDVLRVADNLFVEHWGGVADQMDDFLTQIDAL